MNESIFSCRAAERGYLAQGIDTSLGRTRVSHQRTQHFACSETERGHPIDGLDVFKPEDRIGASHQRARYFHVARQNAGILSECSIFLRRKTERGYPKKGLLIFMPRGSTHNSSQPYRMHVVPDERAYVVLSWQSKKPHTAPSKLRGM